MNMPVASANPAAASAAARSPTMLLGSEGSDQVHVHYNSNGSARVTVNGVAYDYTREQARNLDIRTGGGDDTITVDRREARRCRTVRRWR